MTLIHLGQEPVIMTASYIAALIPDHAIRRLNLRPMFEHLVSNIPTDAVVL